MLQRFWQSALSKLFRGLIIKRRLKHRIKINILPFLFGCKYRISKFPHLHNFWRIRIRISYCSIERLCPISPNPTLDLSILILSKSLRIASFRPIHLGSFYKPSYFFRRYRHILPHRLEINLSDSGRNFAYLTLKPPSSI